MLVVIATGRALGTICRRIGQPPVIGEIIAGIVLGPSLLGWIAPRVMGALFPAGIMPVLETIARVGVVLYMFLIGLELNLGVVRASLRTTLVTSVASIVVPMALGSVLAFALHPVVSVPGVPVLHFALFLGVAMSVTAFPVLARILVTLGMTSTPLGVLAIACAAINDVVAWGLLAFVAGLVQAAAQSTAATALLTAAFVSAMFGFVGPLFRRLTQPAVNDSSAQGSSAVRPPSAAVLILTLAALVGAAGVTSAIGIHEVFGAFLLGAVIPHDSALARTLCRRLTGGVAVLLPAFFALTGLRAQIGLVSTAAGLAICGALIVVATMGKVGGTAIGARLSGLGWSQAAGLGVLMNTRGLMELIVLNVGLELGVISLTLFTMLAIMAIVTTMMTTPIVRRLRLG